MFRLYNPSILLLTWLFISLAEIVILLYYCLKHIVVVIIIIIKFL